MKKIFFILLFLLSAPVFATTMCAQDDIVAIVLDPEVNGTDVTYDASLHEWGTTFSYGVVFGISTCLDTEGSNYTAVDELRAGDGKLALGGESKGPSCWCKMTHPAVSHWALQRVRASIDGCGITCAADCARDIRSSAIFRAAMFNSILD